MTDIKLSKAKFTTYQIIVLAVLALLQFMVILDFMIISPMFCAKASQLSLEYIKFRKLCYNQ